MQVFNDSRGVALGHSVQLARSLWARSRGLLGRRQLNPGEGLLLEPCSGIHTLGMIFPIDAIFLNREGSVVHLVQEMRPLRVSRYVFHARSVLELPAGTIEESGTQVGDHLAFED